MSKKSEVEKLQDKIKKLQDKIQKLQEACSHENRHEKHCGSTGGYDVDEYWIDYKCCDCLKKWSEYYG